jgi:hypothetical protein
MKNAGGANGGSMRDAEALSDASRGVLQRLDAPVEIRFYSGLDSASVSPELRAFSDRVNRLLSEFEKQAAGKIKVTRYTSLSDANAKMASADGISFFNRDKGDASFLGITVAQDGRKEVLPLLSPDWENALESDLSRAIARTYKAPATGVATVPADNSASEQVKQILPDVNAVSAAEGTRILREAALKEYAAAASEAQRQVSEAQQRLIAAQSGASEAEQQAAMKHLQEVQQKQTEELKTLAERFQARLAAFQQLKSGQR